VGCSSNRSSIRRVSALVVVAQEGAPHLSQRAHAAVVEGGNLPCVCVVGGVPLGVVRLVGGGGSYYVVEGPLRGQWLKGSVGTCMRTAPVLYLHLLRLAVV
jgi:hypothetical protein